MAIESYRDLHVWRLGIELAEEVYRLTRCFPKSELDGLVSQMQRAGVSVAANIAEGHARDSTKEFLHHISIALGSLAEVETFLELAERLGYRASAATKPVLAQCTQEGRMLHALQRQVKKRLRPRD